MKRDSEFLKNVCNLAIPVALQSMLQSSFSLVDQIMIGQLGSTSIAGVGFAGKFSSIFTVVVSAIGAVAGIMISQYMGQKNGKEVRRSFYLNLFMGLGLAMLFTVMCLAFPEPIMGMYTKDSATRLAAANYLAIISGTFLPVAGATMLSTLFRCMEKASLPLYASIVAAVVNTGLNYVLIFGKFDFPAMGAKGVAVATVVAQLINFFIMFVLYFQCKKPFTEKDRNASKVAGFHWGQYAGILLPLLVCEFMWSLGENIYAAIYGHMGTDASAAMTLINPIQGLMIGALCGLSQAASVIIGKKLGVGEYEEAYLASKKLLYYGFIGSAFLSVVILVISPFYVHIFQVEEHVKNITKQILLAYALVAPFKVENMILGGGILRCGGKTNYVMAIDLIGTWMFGVPLGLLTAFVLKLSIPYVYFILSLEECVRFAISFVIMRRKNWMVTLTSDF